VKTYQYTVLKTNGRPANFSLGFAGETRKEAEAKAQFHFGGRPVVCVGKAA
jgi:hypothetical protein